MKIVVLSGSPHKNGTSAALVEGFIKGATESAHEVVRFDTAFMNVHPCIACEKCHQGAGSTCAFDDDMSKINKEILGADLIAFAAPVYYYGLCAQLKVVIDRFYANDEALHGNKKVVLLTTMADTSMESAEPSILMTKSCANYLNWEIAGIINASGCYTKETLDSKYINQAYKLGKAL